MNVLRFELRHGWKSAVIWAICLTALAGLYISIFPSVSQDTSVTQLLQNFPEAYRKAFNITADSFSLFPNLYAIVLNLVVLAGSIQAMGLGVGIVSKEVRDKTADFLLTKPVGRLSVELQKLTAAVLLILVTNALFLMLTWGLIVIFIDDPFSFQTFLTASSLLILVQSFFLALGVLFGSAAPKVKSVIAVSLPTVIGFYVLGLLDSVIGEDRIKYLTPFRLFDINALVGGGSYQTSSLLYLTAVIIVAITAGLVAYRHRDIDSV
jgi:ABC-2 type transport system permease protein